MIAYLLFFIFLYLTYRRYKSWLINGSILYYIAAACCGLLTHYLIKPEAYSTFLSVIFHLLVLFLFLKPILEYGKREKVRSFLLLDNQRFTILSYSLIGLQLFSIIFFAPDVFEMLARGDLGQVRSEILSAGRGTGSLPRTIAGVASFYYGYNLLLFFYSLSFRNDSRRFLFLLMLSSVSRIFHSLTYMGRDGILFWILSFVFSFFVFKPYLSDKAKNVVKWSALLIGSFAFLLLGAISISRFSGTDSGTLLSLVNYFGQPMNNFGMLFDRVHEYDGTKTIFPLLFGEKGISGADAIDAAENFVLRYGIASNAFYSFVGNFYLAWGPFITLFIAFIYSTVMCSIVKKTKTTVPMLIVLMIVIQIVIHNYFYWAYYIAAANLYLFTTPIFLIFCSKSSGIIVNQRIN